MKYKEEIEVFLPLGKHITLDASQSLSHVAIIGGSGASPVSHMSSWVGDAIIKGQGLVFLSNIIDENRLLGILGWAKKSGREQDIAIIYLTDACQMTETQRKLIAGDIAHAVKQGKIVLLPTCQWDKIENASKEGEAVMDILFRFQQNIPMQETPLLTILDEYQRLHFYSWAHEKFSKRATELGMACVFYMRKGLQPNREFCESALNCSGTKVFGSSDNSHFNALGARWISQGQKSRELANLDTRELDNYLNEQGHGEAVVMRNSKPATPIRLLEQGIPIDLCGSFEEVERHLKSAQQNRVGLPARAQRYEIDGLTISSHMARTPRRI